MKTDPHSLIISDLHLSQNEPEITKLFMCFLENIAPQAEALYILGDLFEFWIGDDDLSPFHLKIIKALKILQEQGVKIFILPGNRDFLLGKKFMKMLAAEKLSELCLVNFYGKKMLLAHGDSLCLDDKPYQRYRKIVQCALVQKIFLSLPLAIRRQIATKIRARSTGTRTYQDVNAMAVIKVLKQFKTDYLIHGHTHRFAIHYHEEGKQRFVLGAWHASGSYIKINENQLLLGCVNII